MEHNSYELKTLGLLNQRNSLKFPVFTFFSDLKPNPDGLLWSQTTYLTKNLRLKALTDHFRGGSRVVSFDPYS